jgi:hypothetical protein
VNWLIGGKIRIYEDEKVLRSFDALGLLRIGNKLINIAILSRIGKIDLCLVALIS